MPRTSWRKSDSLPARATCSMAEWSCEHNRLMLANIARETFAVDAPALVHRPATRPPFQADSAHGEGQMRFLIDNRAIGVRRTRHELVSLSETSRRSVFAM